MAGAASSARGRRGSASGQRARWPGRNQFGAADAATGGRKERWHGTGGKLGQGLAQERKSGGSARPAAAGKRTRRGQTARPRPAQEGRLSDAIRRRRRGGNADRVSRRTNATTGSGRGPHGKQRGPAAAQQASLKDEGTRGNPTVSSEQLCLLLGALWYDGDPTCTTSS